MFFSFSLAVAAKPALSVLPDKLVFDHGWVTVMSSNNFLPSVVVNCNIRTLLAFELSRDLFLTTEIYRPQHVVVAVQKVIVTMNGATTKLACQAMVTFLINVLTTLVDKFLDIT